jgi:hypothetical protein
MAGFEKAENPPDFRGVADARADGARASASPAGSPEGAPREPAERFCIVSTGFAALPDGGYPVYLASRMRTAEGSGQRLWGVAREALVYPSEEKAREVLLQEFDDEEAGMWRVRVATYPAADAARQERTVAGTVPGTVAGTVPSSVTLEAALPSRACAAGRHGVCESWRQAELETGRPASPCPCTCHRGAVERLPVNTSVVPTVVLHGEPRPRSGARIEAHQKSACEHADRRPLSWKLLVEANGSLGMERNTTSRPREARCTPVEILAAVKAGAFYCSGCLDPGGCLTGAAEYEEARGGTRLLDPEAVRVATPPPATNACPRPASPEAGEDAALPSPVAPAACPACAAWEEREEHYLDVIDGLCRRLKGVADALPDYGELSDAWLLTATGRMSLALAKAKRAGSARTPEET